MFATLKAKLIAAGAILLLIVGLYGAMRYYRGEAQEARQEAKEAKAVSKDLTAARRADVAAQEVLEATRQTIIEHERIGRESTEEALEANRDWADQPVPADVLDSLRD